MAKSITRLTIFISGTSETESEKSGIKTVAADLSKKLENTHGVTIKVKKWPDDFRPAVSEDPVDEIIRQLDGDFDIYLGLLGSRFGEPTSRAESGTEHEFNYAISHYHKDTSSIRIFFYFKKSHENAFEIDPMQLEKVQQFKKKLPSLGVLYKEFNDIEDFLNIVSDDLYDLITNEWQQDKWEVRKVEKSKIEQGSQIEVETNQTDNKEIVTTEQKIRSILTEQEDDDDDDDDDIYLLDILRDLHESKDSILENMDLISEYTKDLGDNVSRQTEEMNIIQSRMATYQHMGGSRESQKLISQLSNIVNTVADEMESYSRKLNPQVSNLPNELNIFLENYSKLYKYQTSIPNLDNEEIEEAFDSLEFFIGKMIETKDSMIRFQKTISEILALTRKFKRSRKRAAASIGQLVAALTIGINKGQVILSDLDQYSS